MRVKMLCDRVVPSGDCEEVHFSAAIGPENEEWAQSTPMGQAQLTIAKKEAQGTFKAQQHYFLDFAEA